MGPKRGSRARVGPLFRRSHVAPVIAVLLLAGARLYDEADATGRQSIVRHFSPADRATGRYQYIPFEVLPGTRRLQVSYEYDKANGDNTIDLGLFEPGSLEIGTRAFRGYSGGARNTVTIDAAGATPGYEPGPLQPGRWHVLLGLYRVAAGGVDVTLTIDTDAEARPRADAAVSDAPAAPSAPVRRTAPVAPVAPAAPAVEGSRWYLGALHTHTVHSDGTLTPAALMQQFASAGYDFVVITDHNNTTHRHEMQRYSQTHPRPLWIAGEEVTTPNGHANVWGLDAGEWVDFRVRAEDKGIGALVAAARRLGALFAINHPASTCLGCGWEHDLPADVAAIEISNGRHGEVDAAVARWDRLLAAGRRITGVGSSDWHAAPNPIDVANVRVFAAGLRETAILPAIAAGRVIVMNGAGWRTPEITVAAGGLVAGIGGSLPLADGRIRVDVNAADLAGGRVTPVINGRQAEDVMLDARGRTSFDRTATPGYVRFELRAADGSLVALTNPVYLER